MWDISEIKVTVTALPVGRSVYYCTVTSAAVTSAVVVFSGGQKRSHLICQNTGARRPWYSHSPEKF